MFVGWHVTIAIVWSTDIDGERKQNSKPYKYRVKHEHGVFMKTRCLPSFHKHTMPAARALPRVDRPEHIITLCHTF